MAEENPSFFSFEGEMGRLDFWGSALLRGLIAGLIFFLILASLGFESTFSIRSIVLISVSDSFRALLSSDTVIVLSESSLPLCAQFNILTVLTTGCFASHYLNLCLICNFLSLFMISTLSNSGVDCSCTSNSWTFL